MTAGMRDREGAKPSPTMPRRKLASLFLGSLRFNLFDPKGA
ncbi:MAG TPA: hypothetical protein VMV04_15215 [Thermodesulfobacteriota bacterium]|nr:hypothetical protein [Thermodesulfobacteriota bacterium]